MDSNQYNWVLTKNAYVDKVNPMSSNRKDGGALKLLCKDFCVPEKITFGSSKEKACKGTLFMKEVHSQGIGYHIIYPDLHNQNPFEGVMREVSRKWYHTMVKKGTKATMGLWCKLGINGNVNDSLFRK